MSFNEDQIGFNFGDSTKLDKVYFFKDIIIDRGSHYSVFGAPIQTKEEVKEIVKNLKKQEYFTKATHNSYAFRIQNGTGVIEGKNDDGEHGAGMCILRELERANALDIIVVVTRYFGGVMLQNDRFKHVIDAVKILFEKSGR